jgi:hypothetical protein
MTQCQCAECRRLRAEVKQMSAPPAAPKPCCRRIGQWWCTRTDQHEDSECTTPPDRVIEPGRVRDGRRR